MKLSDFSIVSEKKRGVCEPDLVRTIRLLAPSQGATIAPPLGPTLGQFGINIKEFCDKFNDRSKVFDSDVVLSIFVNLFRNKTFDFVIRSPSVGFMINEEEVELENEYVNKYLTLSSAYKIVIAKEHDVKISRESLLNCVYGTVRSMDVKIVNDVLKD